MMRSATPKLTAYAGLAALGLLAALATGLPELVTLAAPFALLPAIGLLNVRRPGFVGDFTLDRERVLEGEEVTARIALEARRGGETAEVLLELPPEVVPATGENPRALHLREGHCRELELTLTCGRWGAFRIGRLYVRTHDIFGFFRHEIVLDHRAPLKVYPRQETLRNLLRPSDTQVFLGNYVARERGEGIEFADLRPFGSGDRVRDVNWRASARRQELWVNQRHAERNADVVIFVDSFAEARRADRSTLDPAVRAAAALVGAYLREKDRVGFVSFGSMLNWLLPAAGTKQLYRIVDAMLDTEIVLTYAWEAVDVIPTRTVPARALIIALTPLLDDRSVNVLLDVRRRGFDLIVVEISPHPYLPELSDELHALARRLWRLRREAQRGKLERVGVPVAVWDDDSSLIGALEEVRTSRRLARSARG
jgi:uncharacterized protein (DUF58 family)